MHSYLWSSSLYFEKRRYEINLLLKNICFSRLFEILFQSLACIDLDLEEFSQIVHLIADSIHGEMSCKMTMNDIVNHYLLFVHIHFAQLQAL